MPLSRLEVLEAPVCKKKHVKSMEGFGVTWSNASVNFLPKTVVCLDMLLFVFICFKICVCVCFDMFLVKSIETQGLFSR